MLFYAACESNVYFQILGHPLRPSCMKRRESFTTALFIYNSQEHTDNKIQRMHKRQKHSKIRDGFQELYKMNQNMLIDPCAYYGHTLFLEAKLQQSSI